jgi:large subunit ribosomal protein L35
MRGWVVQSISHSAIFRTILSLVRKSEYRSIIVARKPRTGKIKLKTHKATAKRFRLTGSGKLVRTKIGKSHLRRNTSKRSKALFAEAIPVKGTGIIKRVHRLAPYLSKYKANPNARSGQSKKGKK